MANRTGRRETITQHPDLPWWRTVTRYQWFVFAVVSGAWLFDTMDQRLFSLARIPALADLMGLPASSLEVQAFAKTSTALFLVGWGIGGLTFGALGDRFGRVRLLTISILLYSICTGLTALCRTHEEFAILRFVTGLGIGGIFGLAVAILAETMSGAARLAMLAGLQVLSTFGNVGAAFVKMGVDTLGAHGWIDSAHGWRWLFAIGALPALLAILSALRLRESDAWLKLKAEGQLPKGIFGSYGELLRQQDERHNLLIGTLLAVAGVVGLWAIGEYAVDLQHAVFTGWFSARLPADQVAAAVASAKNWSFMLQMAGGAIGMWIFSWIAARFGRRPAFVAGFSAALIVTLFVYWRLESPADAYWMMPLMGAAQFSVFAGFSIYLPELFGARTRGTGVSFAYNLGRFAAAIGSFGSAYLTTHLYGGLPAPDPLRFSAMTMCAVFLIGIVTALFAPETRGRALRD
ncbi:MFS transporter [Sphingomonas flavalba]|uniref:MFS transporter n=1 Tax=Sphingomonas flavalba TaxID=2559804 RepID=UPI001EF0BA8A|nr:MFS transporter [Sphingomonas flavalba]